MIIDDIHRMVATYTGHRGYSPQNLYLGRNQVDQVRAWAKTEGYIEADSPFEPGDLEGGDRPEIYGLLLFVVNDSDHLMVA